MARTGQRFNPFYILAMIFGVAFTITACAYGLMMLKSIRPEGLPREGQPGAGLMDLLRQQGTAILAIELAGLAVFSIAAIYLDHIRGQRQIARRDREKQETKHEGEPLRTDAGQTG